MVTSTMMSIMGQMVCFTGQQMTWEEAMNSKYVAGPDVTGWDMAPPTKPDAAGLYPIPVPGITKLG